MTAVAEPIVFPPPPDETTASMIEDTAEQIHAEYTYRTLLDCRELATKLVEAVLCWDAEWPEAEGDCACTGPSHRFGCVWDPKGEVL